MNIFDNPIINIAIAVIITWAFFAIFTSLIVEAFAQIKAERGRFMKNYLLQQLEDLPNGINWGALLYTHGNIDLLSRNPEKPTADIDPKLFAQTIVDVVANAQIVQMKTSVNTYKNQTLSDFKKAIQTLENSDVMDFLTQAMKSAELQGVTNLVLDESVVYAKLIENIENWFNQMTERLSLWYKKKTRQSLFILGLILAFIVNVDSVQLFSLYNNDPTVRKAVISYYENSPYKLKSDTNQLALKDFIKSLDTLKKETVLPIGFDNNAIKLAVLEKKNPDSTTKHFSFWWWKLIGIIISGFAASFGGPFWFDVLKKIYSVKDK